MSSSDVTREGISAPTPGREAVTGARGRGLRRRGGERAMVPRAQFESYYGKPVLNQPVWKHAVPVYFFTGGLAAGSSLLALGADLTGNNALRRQCRYTAAVSLALSTGLLIEDLGMPSRFHHMLRVFKPTSPMSVGSWILAGYGPAAMAAAGSEATGVLPVLGSVAGAAAALMSPPLGAYTAVILAGTSVPVWHEERQLLPFAFVGSAMAAAGGLAVAANSAADAAPARRMAVLGAGLETVATRLGRRHLGEIGEVYDTGPAGLLRKVSEAATVVGTAAIVGSGLRAGARSRAGRAAAIAGGALLLAGSLLERLSVFEAGKASANDPKYVVKPQRERVSSRTPTWSPARP